MPYETRQEPFMHEQLSVAIIGAGPVGLTAASHLLSRGLEPIIFEAGDEPGASVRDWGHVRVFSPWRYNIDPVAAELLESNGWIAPLANEYPTGAEIVADYIEPLAAVPAISSRLHLGSRVTRVSRHRIDKLKDAGREDAPFELTVERDGVEERHLAPAVIDASGTWTRPNPLGANGLPAAGEEAHADRVAYAIPDVLDRDRARYAGKRVLVVGSGHSAFNVMLDLVSLREQEPRTEILWAIRGGDPGRAFGGGEADQLPARAALGEAIRNLVEDGGIELVAGFHIDRVESHDEQVVVADGDRQLVADEVIAATGFRPDLTVLGELRLDLDDRVEAPRSLAPLIDPNVHSCGTVPPHGVDELSHPDTDVYVVGMKSYGRAPTFLLRTGYEQARSVVAALAGDWESARRVELVLPETGVCSVTRDASCDDDRESPVAACCGTATEDELVADAV
jgi:NADPH-dependent 2,4-dienoyl-CoA reductase/sulfur reductase-like enzyme